MTRENHEIVDGAQLGKARDDVLRTIAEAVVEHAVDAQVRVLLRGELGQQLLARRTAAHHRDAAVEASRARESPRDDRHDATLDHEATEGHGEPAQKPDTRKGAIELGEKDDRQRGEEHQRETAREAEALIDRMAEGADVIDAQRLKHDDRASGHGGNGDEIFNRVARFGGQIEPVDEEAARQNDQEIKQSNEARENDGRIGGFRGLTRLHLRQGEHPLALVRCVGRGIGGLSLRVVALHVLGVECCHFIHQ